MHLEAFPPWGAWRGFYLQRQSNHEQLFLNQLGFYILGAGGPLHARAHTLATYLLLPTNPDPHKHTATGLRIQIVIITRFQSEDHLCIATTL
jgi:hypothetical protein